MPEFEHDAHKQAYEKVGGYLKDSFGSQGFTANPAVPVYVGVTGSALVEVGVLPWGSDDAVVVVRSCCVMGMDEVPAECMKFLLESNYNFRFGAFGLDGESDVVFEHTLAAGKLDKEELEASVVAVQGTADRFDDEIVKNWGGMTGREKFLQAAKEAGLTPP
jgi:hypothetical protein